MNLLELRQIPHLSASAVSDYISCGLMYKLGRVDKKKPDFKSDALIFGTAIHAALAEFYTALGQNHKMTARELQETFASHWDEMTKDREDIKYKAGKDVESLLLEGRELLGAFHNQFVPESALIIGVEEAFSFNIPGLDIPVIGAFDLVMEDESGVITIVDHKTSSRAYADSDVDKSMQMTLYQMAARANGFNKREILLRFDCLIKTKTPKFEQYYTTRTVKDETRTARKLIAVLDGIKKGVFVPNEENWRCAGCSYKSSCEEWFAGGNP